MKADSKVFKEISGEVPNTYAIGNASSARNIM